jgi:SsrA-binding protein
MMARMSLLEHKRVRFDYEILETIEAGIELTGLEVKSLRGKHGSLAGAYVSVDGGEAFLVGAHIPPFQPGNTPSGYDPYQRRKLLLTKKELSGLKETERQAGLTIVPISVYSKGRHIKVAIGIARGKKKRDKRETLKKKDAARDIARTLKNQE